MPEPDAPATRVVLVAVCGKLFGLPLERCREVVPPRPVTPLPGSPTAVLGLVNLRGRLVTVLDLGIWLGAAPSSGVPTHSIVMVDHGGRQFGLAVEEVVHIVPVPPLEADPADRGATTLPLDPALLPDSVWKDAGIFACLALDALFEPVLA